MIAVRRQIELETFFLLVIGAGISLFFVTYKNNYQPQFSIASSMPSMQVSTEAVAPKITISSQISPDGSKKLIMKTTQNNDNTATYDFSTANENGTNEKLIFTEVVDSSKNMTVPFNAWSPDDQYFFIQEDSGDSKNIFVFKVTGKSFADTQIYLDASSIFKEANTGNNFSEATGWASESLIILNTKKQDNTKGPSYWLEVPSKAIIQLSTEF